MSESAGQSGRVLGLGADSDAILALASAVVFPAIGVAIGVWLTGRVLIPRLGLGATQRIVEMATHIDAIGRAPAVVFMGNSITIEGVDAGIVSESLGPERSAESWAINGSSPGELAAALPRVLASRPRFVVFSLGVRDLGEPSDVPANKAFAYGVGGFGRAWPSGTDASMFPGLEERTLRRFHSSRLAVWIHFRSLPLSRMEASLRRGARKELRATPTAERWVRPYELTGSISGWQLDRHLRSIAETWRTRLAGGTADGERSIGILAEFVRGAGATPVLCVAPQHPAFHEEFADAIARLGEVTRQLAAEHGGIALDASSLLDADGFADALHPNGAGRAVYSRFVAEGIAAAARGDGGG